MGFCLNWNGFLLFWSLLWFLYLEFEMVFFLLLTIWVLPFWTILSIYVDLFSSSLHFVSLRFIYFIFLGYGFLVTIINFLPDWIDCYGDVDWILFKTPIFGLLWCLIHIELGAFYMHATDKICNEILRCTWLIFICLSFVPMGLSILNLLS